MIITDINYSMNKYINLDFVNKLLYFTGITAIPLSPT